jgi:hypothetical protein
MKNWFSVTIMSIAYAANSKLSIDMPVKMPFLFSLSSACMHFFSTQSKSYILEMIRWFVLKYFCNTIIFLEITITLWCKDWFAHFSKGLHHNWSF